MSYKDGDDYERQFNQQTGRELKAMLIGLVIGVGLLIIFALLFPDK